MTRGRVPCALARALVPRGRVACGFLACLLVVVASLAGGVVVAVAAVPDEVLDVLGPGAQGQGFSIAGPPYAFEFPRDHGPHPDFRQEWWYLTGNLTSAGGERFGFELTIFRVALTSLAAAVPAGSSTANTGAAMTSGAAATTGTAAASAPSRWHARQVYIAHFAVTDVSRKTFRSAQKYERDALGLAGARAEPFFRAWVDDWEIGGGPHWTVRAQQKGYELKLEVESLASPILNGEHGLSVKSNESGAASYYYSIPRVSVHGELIRDGVPISVGGVAWFDREWGSGSLGPNGWDWFALQLGDGSALMFYALRNKDGSRETHSAGTWVDAAGQTRALSSTDVEISVGDHWQSPRGGRYPSRWRVRVPSISLDVDVQPVLADQELATIPRYWEGAVDVRGSRGADKATGRGYVELVGYAGQGAASREGR